MNWNRTQYITLIYLLHTYLFQHRRCNIAKKRDFPGDFTFTVDTFPRGDRATRLLLHAPHWKNSNTISNVFLLRQSHKEFSFFISSIQKYSYYMEKFQKNKKINPTVKQYVLLSDFNNSSQIFQWNCFWSLRNGTRHKTIIIDCLSLLF